VFLLRPLRSNGRHIIRLSDATSHYIYRKRDLRELGWDDMDWVDVAQDRDEWRALVNTVMNLRIS
jgi:hypothetical protein